MFRGTELELGLRRPRSAADKVGAENSRIMKLISPRSLLVASHHVMDLL